MLAAAAVGAVVAVGVVAVRDLPPGRAAPAAVCTASVAGATPVRLDPEQAANATTIAAVGRRLGLADHAVTIALATAMQESELRNLDHGDRDSVGLFQQRPSQGWGTAEQVGTPTYAAAAFYRKLAQVDGWDALPVTVAAQAVQRSAFPQAYGDHEDDARTLARAMTGQVPAALTCAHLRSGGGLQSDDLRGAARAELGADGLTASRPGDVWAAASWVVAHADTYGVTTVTAQGQRWTATSGRWTPDPSATGLELS